MSVHNVKFIRIVGPNARLDDVTLACAKSGVFQPDSAIEFYSDNKKFMPVGSKNELSDCYEQLKSSIASSGIEPDYVDITGFHPPADEIRSFTNSFCANLNALVKEKTDAENKLAQYNKRYEEASHFLNREFDITRLSNCRFVTAGFGKLPKEGYQRLKVYDNPHFTFSVLSQDDEYYWGVYVAPKEYSDEAERTFTGLGYVTVEIGKLNEKSDEYSEDAKAEILTEINSKILSAKEKIDEYITSQIDNAQRYFAYLEMTNKLNRIKSMAVVHNGSFIFVGWVPTDDEETLINTVKQINGVEYTVTNGKEELKHSPPVKLKNPRLFKPFEFYVGMFGLPDYNEMDPTIFVAITYTLLFGVMFADLGQGLLLSLIGYFMWKFKKMALGKILIPCGISSAIFGFAFGSVFGLEHLLDPVFFAMGFKEKPIEVMESATINTIVYAAVVIGVVLVLVAMLLNVYSAIKQKDWGRALFDQNGVAGIMFYGSLVGGLVSTILLDNNVFSPAYILGLIILPLLLMFMREPLGKLLSHRKNWQPESWGEYVIQTFFEMFETMLSYVSNTMSFLRVGAFILVHTGMMMVVSILAGDPSSIAYIPVMIVGNIIVLALEALLVGIQVLRLEFYEMFSRFYTGSGREFKPVDINS